MLKTREDWISEKGEKESGEAAGKNQLGGTAYSALYVGFRAQNTLEFGSPLY